MKDKHDTCRAQLLKEKPEDNLMLARQQHKLPLAEMVILVLVRFHTESHNYRDYHMPAWKDKRVSFECIYIYALDFLKVQIAGNLTGAFCNSGGSCCSSNSKGV